MTLQSTGNSVISRPYVAATVSDLIGWSPLLQIPFRSSACQLYLKLERTNPGGSVKDRAVREMCDAAERRGTLGPGRIVIENTSGNTGVSLAMLGAARGYKVILIIDNHVPPEKAALMRAYGAQIEHVGADLPPDEQPGELRQERLRELLRRHPNAFYLDQGDNLDNGAAHYKTTAEELLASLGKVDFLFATAGTGGTISGTSKRLREQVPSLISVAVEPVGSVLFGGCAGKFFMSGAGSTLEKWKNVDYNVITSSRQVTDREAFNTCRLLGRRLGLLVGGTGGAVVYTAIDYIRTHQPIGIAVAVVPDGGDHYLSTIFNTEWMQSHGLLDENISQMLESALRVP